jgi:hypothetical protein
MRNRPDLGMCLRCNSVAIVALCFRPPHLAAERHGEPPGE